MTVSNSRSSSSSQGPHSNAITCIQVKKQEDGICEEISTSGLDGRVVVWNMQSILTKMNLL